MTQGIDREGNERRKMEVEMQLILMSGTLSYLHA